MTKLSVMPFASAAAEMSRQAFPVKGTLFPNPIQPLLSYWSFFYFILFAFFRPLSQSRRILLYFIDGSLPPSLPVPLLLLYHSFCITFQFLQAFSGHLKSWLTRSVGHVESWFIIYLRKRIEHSIEQKNAVTCLHLAKSKVKLDRQR